MSIVRDVDRGFAKLLDRAKKAKGLVEVGVLSGAGSEAKTQDPRLSVLDVAIWNEFGLGVPERSFVRAYVDENQDKIEGWIRTLSSNILQGKITEAQALEQLGLKVVAGMQKRISDGVPPPNAPSTIARKGSSKPLVDSGQLKSSITHRVKP